MGARRGRRILSGVLLAAAVATVGVTPVAADTNLIIGGQAIVSKTNGDGVNVRDAAGYGSNILFAIPENAEVKVIGGPNTLGDGSVWYNVEVNGTVGWIVSDYLVLASLTQGASVTVHGTGGNGLRLREGPSLSANTLTVMPDGAELSVIGGDQTSEDGTVWANVSYNGMNGFAARAYLTSGGGGSAAPVAEPISEPKQDATGGIAVGGNAEVVNTGGSGLNLRYDVGYGAGVATVAAEGDVVHVIDGPRTDAAGDVWWGVDYKGHKGWMFGAYLTPTDRAATPGGQPGFADGGSGNAGDPGDNSLGARIVAEAMKYHGYPYVWGGVGPNGFDCSGFVYYVVNQVTGGGFPRVMDAQVMAGTYVDPSDLRPGDIVFQQNTYQWGLSHAGIYIGDGKFINAANESTGVTISNLWDSYWGPRYYTARRIG